MNVLRGKHLYLSGPIENGDPTSNWRVEPTNTLSGTFGLNVFDPNSDPKQKWLPELFDARDSCNFDKMAEIATKFVRKDLQIVQRTDILVAYLPKNVATTGTHKEIDEAWDNKIPVLFVCPQGKQYNPAWYFGYIKHKYMFGSFLDLYEYLWEVEDGKHQDDLRWAMVYGLI